LQGTPAIKQCNLQIAKAWKKQQTFQDGTPLCHKHPMQGKTMMETANS